MRLVGAALILGGAAMLCFALLDTRRRERDALRALAAALETLEREVRSSLIPLPRLLERCSHGQGGAFFAAMLALQKRDADRPLPDCWCAAANALPLSKRQRESLSRVADALGGEEADLLRALRRTCEELRTELSSLEREHTRDSRLIPTLCFSLSLLLTVLLI